MERKLMKEEALKGNSGQFIKEKVMKEARKGKY